MHDYTAPSVPGLYPPLGEISESRLLSTEYENENRSAWENPGYPSKRVDRLTRLIRQLY